LIFVLVAILGEFTRRSVFLFASNVFGDRACDYFFPDVDILYLVDLFREIVDPCYVGLQAEKCNHYGIVLAYVVQIVRLDRFTALRHTYVFERVGPIVGSLVWGLWFVVCRVMSYRCDAVFCISTAGSLDDEAIIRLVLLTWCEPKGGGSSFPLSSARGGKKKTGKNDIVLFLNKLWGCCGGVLRGKKISRVGGKGGKKSK